MLNTRFAMVLLMVVGWGSGVYAGYLQTFDLDTSDVPATYPELAFLPDGNATANVTGGVLHIVDGSGVDHPAVLVDARTAFGTAVYPDSLQVDLLIGAGDSGGQDPGNRNVGVVFGDIALVFHPGYRGTSRFPRGSFRCEGVGGGVIVPNRNMGFTPPQSALHEMTVQIEHHGTDFVFDVAVVNPSNPANVYVDSFAIDEQLVGELDVIGVRRSAHAGGDGIFDDLRIVPEPSTWVLLLGGAVGLLAYARRRSRAGADYTKRRAFYRAVCQVHACAEDTYGGRSGRCCTEAVFPGGDSRAL